MTALAATQDFKSNIKLIADQPEFTVKLFPGAPDRPRRRSIHACPLKNFAHPMRARQFTILEQRKIG
jgi:hypothetical protein